MNDFLSKPLTMESLQLVLKRWLATHPLSTETASGVRQSVAQTQQTTFAIQDELASVRARIQELSAILDEEAGRRSWELFLSDSKQTLAAANAQLAAGHTDALARSAHRLAGGALMIGAHGIAQRSKQLEAEAKRGDLSASSELLSGLHAYVSRVVAEDPA
jgi:HPt (histidine-containing phosphotransfer) domain-containing protein